MQLAAGKDRQAAGQRRNDHADAQAGAAAFSAQPVDHLPCIVRRGQRDHLGSLGLIESVEAVDVRRQLGEVGMEKGDCPACVQAGRGAEFQHRKSEGGERPRLDQAEAEALDLGDRLRTIAQHDDFARLESAPSLPVSIGAPERRATGQGRTTGGLVVAAMAGAGIAAASPLAIAVAVSVALAPAVVAPTIPIPIAVAVSVAIALAAVVAPTIPFPLPPFPFPP